MRDKLRPIALLATILYGTVFCSSKTYAADGHGVQAMTYPTCWENAGAYYNIDPWVLYAIAYQESHQNPTATHRNNNGTLDISMMQINSIWFPELRKRGVDPRQLFDGCTSIYVGAWILAQSKQKYGSSWMAVGAYHSSNPKYMRPYAASVNAIYERFKRQYAGKTRVAPNINTSIQSDDDVTVMP